MVALYTGLCKIISLLPKVGARLILEIGLYSSICNIWMKCMHAEVKVKVRFLIF